MTVHRGKSLILLPAKRLAVAALLGLAAVPAATPTHAAVSVESALRSFASGSELIAFYRARNYRPLWIRDGSLGPEAMQLAAMVERAELDGMDSSVEFAERLQDAVERADSGRDRDLAHAEMALSEALVEYVQTLRRPVDVGMTYVDEALEPSLPSANAILGAAAAAPSLAEHLDSVSRLNPTYAQLRDGFAAWRERWGGLPRIDVPGGPPLRLGAEGKRVQLLRQRLGLYTNGPFDQSVAQAVREFKGAHGLPATPVVDTATIEALNKDPQLFENRLKLNLDRARLLPAEDKGRYILVDAAAARLWLYENGRVRDTMRVVVGRPSEPTPMLAGLIRFAVLNPYWNVPPDLVRRRIAPNVLKQGVSYLDAQKYEVLSDWTDEAQVVDPSTIDWAAVAAGREEVRVRQLPGPDNMMGSIKFMFPNDFGVYLHDTPEKSLFSQNNRMQSSGCVRLEDATRLARWLFGKTPRAASAEPEQAVELPRPVPVYITYLTAALEGNGLAFRQDVYGRDTSPRARYASRRRIEAD